METKDNKIAGNFTGKDILTLDQFSPSDLQILFSTTDSMKQIAKEAKPSSLLNGNIVTLLFYEPSSRTFGSFSASVKQLGGQTVEILNPEHFSSVSKGETLEDTIRVFEGYCDVIVIRHKAEGTATKAAEAAFFVPIINAGDGIGEHPTQALLDMYTLYEKFQRLDHLTGVIGGDLLNGRTVHSLIKGLSLYPGNSLYLLSPQELMLSDQEMLDYKKRGLTLFSISKEEEMPRDADFWYWTRVQKERFTDENKYESVKNKFIVTPELVHKFAGKNTIIMHPLPRAGEIDPAVDADPRAVYLRSQTRNGMYIRMALLAHILGKV